MQRIGRFLVWLIAVDVLMATFGTTTGPLLVAVAIDSGVVLLILRSLAEMRAVVPIETGSVIRNRGHRGGIDVSSCPVATRFAVIIDGSRRIRHILPDYEL